MLSMSKFTGTLKKMMLWSSLATLKTTTILKVGYLGVFVAPLYAYLVNIINNSSIILENGFQIVDTQPKKVMILLNTGTPDVFIVKGKDAIVYKKNGSWIYALNSGNDLKLSDINLKF